MNYFISNHNNIQNNNITIFELSEVVQLHVRDDTRTTFDASDRPSVNEEEELGASLATPPPGAILRQGSAASRTRRMLSVTSEWVSDRRDGW